MKKITLRCLHSLLLGMMFCIPSMGVAQYSISGPTCVAAGVSIAPYLISGGPISSADKWCISGGTVTNSVGSSSTCLASNGSSGVSIVWNSGISGGTISYYHPATAGSPSASLTVNISTGPTYSPPTIFVPTGLQTTITFSGTNFTTGCGAPYSNSLQSSTTDPYTYTQSGSPPTYTVTGTFTHNTNFVQVFSNPSLMVGTVSTIITAVVPQTPFTPGTVSPASQCAISGVNSATTLTATLPTNSIYGPTFHYQWQSSTDNVNWINAGSSGTTDLPYSPGALIATTYFRQSILAGPLTMYTNVVSVSVVPPVTPGTISTGSMAINYNTSPGTINCPAATGGCSGSYSYQWQSSPDGINWSNASGTSTGQNYTAPTLTATTYYRRAVVSGGTTLYTVGIKILVYPQLVSGSIGPSNQIINYGKVPAPLTLSGVSGGSGVYSYSWQYSSTANGTYLPIANTNSSTYSPPALQSTTWYEVVTTSNGVSITSSAAEVFVYPLLSPGWLVPSFLSILAGTSPGPLISDPASGSSCNGTYAYQWQSAADGINFTNIASAAGLSYTPGPINANTYYRIRVVCGIDTAYTNICQIDTVFSVPDMNFIRSRDIVKTGVLDTLTAANLTSPNDVKQTTQYYDGLGRLVQTVGMQQSPLLHDMVSINEYDNFGRESAHFLPYSSQTSDGNFKFTGHGDQNSFNTQQFAGEQYYYAQINYETSPLSRALLTMAPGSSWTGGLRGVSAQYLVNSSSDSVQIWQPIANPSVQISVTNVTGGNQTVTWTPMNMPAGISSILFLYETAGAPSWTTATVGGPVQTSYTIPAGTYSYAIQVYFSNGNPSVMVYPAFPSNPSYTISGIYTTGSLYKTISTDENNNQVVEFKDVRGLVLLKKVQAGVVTDNAPYSNWLCTYYIYDDANNLRLVIPPKATQQLWATNWSLGTGGLSSSPIASGLCFQYNYDGRNRMITKNIPGAGTVYMIYDAKDRLVLTQDSALHNQKKWLFTKYDTLNRQDSTGLITDPSNYNNPAYHQGLAAASTAYPNLGLYTTEVLTGTYYDDYSWISGGTAALGTSLATTYTTNSNYFITTYNTSPSYAVPITAFANTRGMATGSMTKVVASSPIQYLYGVSFYDDHGRVIQTQDINYTGAVDTLTTQYDFIGKPLHILLNHQKNQHTAQHHNVLEKMNYDAGFRLKSIYKNIDGAASDQLIDSIQYNELGQLRAKYLGNSVDSLVYDYNIRGWVTGINKNYVGGTASHYFGMELGYDKPASIIGTTSYTSPAFNGNIAGTVWKSAGDGVGRKYDFSYDNVNRLNGAAYLDNKAGPWGTTAMDFSVSGLSYDANGNILTMNQHGFKVGSPAATIDSLSYAYQANSNQLSQVIDAANDTTTALGDFHYNPRTKGSTDYSYDGNGNLVLDNNKAIDSIVYNYLNLPQKVHMNGKGNILYTYDAAGEKLQKLTMDSLGRHATTTLYLGDFVYQQTDTITNPGGGLDTLQFMSHEEGRARWAYHTYYYGSTGYKWEYDFFEKDHLGNTRALLTQEKDSSGYGLTMEAAYRNTENALFYNVGPSCSPRMSGYPVDYSWTNPNDSVIRVNGSGQKVGPSIILKVMAGDTLSLGVSYFYNSLGLTNGQSVKVSDLINSLATGIVNLAGTSHGSVSTLTGGASPLNGALNSYVAGNNPTVSGKPNAYLNWILLDNQFNYVNTYPQSGALQVGTAGTTTGGTLQSPLAYSGIPITKSGYLYIYLSNATPGWDVFFDNLNIKIFSGPLKEENHYYPFGLTMAGISDKALRTQYVQNKYRYNGKELQNQEFSDGTGLEEYDYGARFQDPQLGVWHTIDPLANVSRRWSPYNYAYDNPIRFIDPDGMMSGEFEGDYSPDGRLIHPADWVHYHDQYGNAHTDWVPEVHDRGSAEIWAKKAGLDANGNQKNTDVSYIGKEGYQTNAHTEDGQTNSTYKLNADGTATKVGEEGAKSSTTAPDPANTEPDLGEVNEGGGSGGIEGGIPGGNDGSDLLGKLNDYAGVIGIEAGAIDLAAKYGVNAVEDLGKLAAPLSKVLTGVAVVGTAISLVKTFDDLAHKNYGAAAVHGLDTAVGIAVLAAAATVGAPFVAAGAIIYGISRAFWGN